MQSFKSVLTAGIIGLCAIVCVAVASAGVVKAVSTFRTAGETSISATGSATRDFESDMAMWSGSFSATGMTSQEAYETITRDMATIRKYLLDNHGITDELQYDAVDIRQVYRSEYSEAGNYIGEVFEGYRLTQRVWISLYDVGKVEEIAKNSTRLIEYGVDFYPEPSQYYYTQLDTLKLEMIEDATQNAKERIDIVAENAGSTVGTLKNASLGVFQITAWNSTGEEFSSSGVFNTTSRWKTASITVRLQYNVE